VALSNARCQGKPIIGPVGITCSCGVVFDRGEVEDRAAAYLWHRRGGKVSATEAFIWADGMKGATTVPDDKPPPGTMTIRRHKQAQPNHASFDWVVDGVIGYEVRENALVIKQDGGEVILPLDTIWTATYKEG
jgi:hypothetical protein